MRAPYGLVTHYQSVELELEGGLSMPRLPGVELGLLCMLRLPCGGTHLVFFQVCGRVSTLILDYIINLNKVPLWRVLLLLELPDVTTLLFMPYPRRDGRIEWRLAPKHFADL